MLGDCLEEPTDQTFIEWEDGHQKKVLERMPIVCNWCPFYNKNKGIDKDHTSAGPSRKRHWIEPIHSNERRITQMSIATKKIPKYHTFFDVLATSWLKAVIQWLIA